MKYKFSLLVIVLTLAFVGLARADPGVQPKVWMPLITNNMLDPSCRYVITQHTNSIAFGLDTDVSLNGSRVCEIHIKSGDPNDPHYAYNHNFVYGDSGDERFAIFWDQNLIYCGPDGPCTAPGDGVAIYDFGERDPNDPLKTKWGALVFYFTEHR